MKTTFVSTAVAVLIVGCGTQPVQESAKPDQATESAELELAAPKVHTDAQQDKNSSPAKPATLPESQPDEPNEPVATPEEVEAKWKAATQGNWDAATRGNTELIKQLLADGMDVDVTDKEGLTALYRAAHNDRKETVSLLLSQGANVNIRDKFGNTPLDVTLNDNIANMLRQQGGKTGQELKVEGN
ncbi:MAG: ankyrin repeat domain-containing protein [Verrucomicrobiota bacterium]|jgi:hypothetical protein|nr:ankyrin repeat domain-containing protein [Verrucomicrobiota bacterium]